MGGKGRYQPVQDGEKLGGQTQGNPSTRSTSGRSVTLLAICLMVSLTLNTVLLLVLRAPSSSGSDTILPTGDSITGFSKVPKVYRKDSYFARPYVEKNHTVSDAAWDAIELGHGVIKFNKDYALEHGLAPTRAWKPNRTEAVYAFSAYHALHCAVSLYSIIPLMHRLHTDISAELTMAMQVLVRKFLRDHVRDRKEPGKHTWGHAWHCMEVLREEIMCTADGTIQSLPLDPNDRSKALLAGHGETRQCADWTYLRDFSVSLPDLFEFLSTFWLALLPSRSQRHIKIMCADNEADGTQRRLDICRAKWWASTFWISLPWWRWYHHSRGRNMNLGP
ncbi:hypothetical protein FH972_024606 [Carpinus fangiana]|uniref:Uncharacterized protein n=1 Tax=Carpinus fangiana TaxID=176857 RepID=A0A5N6KZ05_9ROSI|nr:hypothetical protein FH972_024606 [Carpinus fangiana]